MWSVVLCNKNDLESVVLERFNTRTNAQLFAESYVAQKVLDHNGLRDLGATLSRKQLEQKLSDPAITNENCYYIIRNNFPWGMTVNAVHIRQLETTKVDEVDCLTTLEVDEVVKVPKQVTVPGGWFSRARVHTVEEDKTVKVPKQITVKNTRVTTTNKRVADSTDVFTVSLVYDPAFKSANVDQSRHERISSAANDRMRCNALASRLANTSTFTSSDGIFSINVADCKKEFPNEFSTYKSFVAINNMGKLLNQLRQETKPLPITKNPFEECDDIFAPPIMGWQQNNDGLRHRKNIGQASDLKSVDIPPPPANPVQIQSSGQIQNSIQIQIPVRNVSGSALAHLNNDIIARHREMFGQPKISQRCQSKKFDDETIENLCNEIERAIKAAEKNPENKLKSAFKNNTESTDDWDSESDAWSDSSSESDAGQESETESEQETESDQETEQTPAVSDEDIFKPSEISP